MSSPGEDDETPLQVAELAPPVVLVGPWMSVGYLRALAEAEDVELPDEQA